MKHVRRGMRMTAAIAVGALLTVPLVSAAAAPRPGVDQHRPSTASTPPADDLGARPYMGWSSYSMQVYAGDGKNWITADRIIAQSDAMHEVLQPSGYEYINVDAGWNVGYDEYGRPTPSAALYPNGLQAVIDHVHGNGQKFGLYAIPGLSPEIYEADLPIHGAPGCTTGAIAKQPLQQADYWDLGYRIDFSNPCAQAYIDSIADMFGQWGVDFLKFDSVTPGSGVGDLSLDARDDVAAWSSALEPHGIWFELSWAVDIRYADFWKEHAQGWRIDWDVECYCEREALTTWENVARLFPRLTDWWRHAGPDGWNDLDSLNVGNGAMDGLTRDERRTAMTLWSVSAAPLYVGNDLTNLDEFGVELLTNEEVIAANQAGRPARPVATDSNRQVWYAGHPDGSVTVAVFNLGRTDADIPIRFADIGLAGNAKVRDLWSQKNLGNHDDEFLAEDVPIHGSRLFTFTPRGDARIDLNDDDARVDYEGAWTRNGGAEVAPASQPFTVAIGDTANGQPATPVTSSRVRTLNNDDPSIVYTGGWGRSGGRGLGDYLDDVHYSEANGSSFEHSFVGTGVDYLTETHESQGDVEIYLDGVLVDTVSTWRDPSEGRGVQQVVYSVRDLPNGAHTIRGVKKSGAFMLVDRLDVVQESLLDTDTAVFDKAPGQQADVPVGLLREPGELVDISLGQTPLTAGTDYVLDGDTVIVQKAFLAGLPVGPAVLDFRFRGDFLGDVHASEQDDASVEIRFTGRSVSVTGPKGPDQGEVEVYLDDQLVATVDTSAAERLTQQEIFTSDRLRKGDHVLRLVAASGEVFRFDRAQYALK